MITVGVLGGGQLGRMLALAGYRLGLRFVFLDPSQDPSAGQVGSAIVAPWLDPSALDDLAARADVVTYEFENVPVDAVRRLAEKVPLHPAAGALEAAQDRLAEKSLFRDLGIATAPFAAVTDLDDVRAAMATVGLPAVLKTRREGYDGKGQVVIRSEDEAVSAHAGLAGRPLLLEGFVPFERELSILAARSTTGETVFYPLAENRHREGILRLSLAPACNVAPALQARAEDLARAVLERLDYAGVLAIELFEHGGDLLANEMAPRVHNSGHWTIDGAATSQFENHLRAILGWPLGATAPTGHAAMVNLIGGVPPLESILSIDGARIHLYGKAPRPGRKVGHVTFVADDHAGRDAALRAIAAVVPEPALATEES